MIDLKNCRVENARSVLIPELSWHLGDGEAWLVIGANNSGKSDFLDALAGNLRFVPADDCDPAVKIPPASDVELVSLENAAKIIQEERESDESDYVEGGVDIGRTARFFILQALHPHLKKGAALPPEISREASRLENHPAVRLCGIESVLDRGLRFLSTGEIRRTMLARALVSGKKLLILSNPFDGLDAQSRKILLDFFNGIVKHQSPAVILGTDRWHDIPDAITNVLEFTERKISFCGNRADYERLLSERKNIQAAADDSRSRDFETAVRESAVLAQSAENPAKKILVEMRDVRVGWDDKFVLDGLNWTLVAGEHWLVRGPNGSGKTTFLELITGDNMQVFSNDVRIFGSRRGSGESVWDIKKRLGIVSYRLHVEYRMLGGTSLRDVIISGFRDSIGLYGLPTDTEISAAKKWLALGGFSGRGAETFGSLSYGEQRAILILRSAVKSPEILILDEPCHGLDENHREKILWLISTICERGGTTVLHVTHDPSEVLDCERHILELRPGERPMYKIIERE